MRIALKIKDVKLVNATGGPKPRMAAHERRGWEVIGGIVEQSCRFCLSASVPATRRFLHWYELSPVHARYLPRLAELDAFWELPGAVVLGEVKTTTNPDNYRAGCGLSQLDRAFDVLSRADKYSRVLRRLIYVGDPVRVKGGLPTVDPCDDGPAVAVIWFTPREIQAAAGEIGLVLPENWMDAAVRDGMITVPGNPEWQKYSSDQSSPADSETALARAFRLAAGVSE